MTEHAETAALAATDHTPTVVKIELEEPIVSASGSVKELTIRKPSAGDLRRQKNINIGQLAMGEPAAVMSLLPSLVSPFLIDEEIDRLSSEDLGEIAGVIAGFFMTKAQKAMVQQMFGN